MAEINCIVVTPEKTSLDQTAEFVALPLFDGEIGIAPGRSRMIGRLGYGEMRLRFGGKIERYYIDGGFVQVSENVVSVLTNRAIPAAEIDADAANKQLAEAKGRRADTVELLEIRDRLIQQARAQLRVAGK
jgi:F-type H+-transporting ATPase subunit epsilon